MLQRGCAPQQQVWRLAAWLAALFMLTTMLLHSKREREREREQPAQLLAEREQSSLKTKDEIRVRETSAWSSKAADPKEQA